MDNNKKPRQLDITPASVLLKNIGQKEEGGKTTIAEVMANFRENAILLAMIFFSLPIAVPLPYPPGFTTLVGVPLIILSFQLLLGSKNVRLPQKVSDYELKNSTLKTISDNLVPIIEKIEKYIKPRYNFARSVYCEHLVGLVSLIAALAVTIPIPFTNAIPALGITVMALGQLGRDGLVIAAGVLIACIGTIIASIVLIGGLAAIKMIFGVIV